MRANLRLLVFILSAFAAGALLGYSFRSMGPDGTGLRQERDALSSRLQQEEARKKHLESELTRIATVDFADYRRLQNEEEQFIKAKEILGKVFLILFHNVLSSVDDEQKKFVLSLTSGQTPDPAPDAPPPEAPAVSPTAAAEPQAPKSDSPVKTPAAVSSAWTLAEKDLTSANPDKAEALLKSLAIKDILSEQGSAQSFRDDDSRLQALQGFYSGEIIFLDPKRKPWTMEMELSSTLSNGSQKGNFMVRITDDAGRRESTLGEEGGIGGILKPMSESSALIVRVYKTRFLQMYIFEKQGVIVGNFYDEQADGKVEHLGHFKLRR